MRIKALWKVNKKNPASQEGKKKKFFVSIKIKKDIICSCGNSEFIYYGKILDPKVKLPVEKNIIPYLNKFALKALKLFIKENSLNVLVCTKCGSVLTVDKNFFGFILPNTFAKRIRFKFYM